MYGGSRSLRPNGIAFYRRYIVSHAIIAGYMKGKVHIYLAGRMGGRR